MAARLARNDLETLLPSLGPALPTRAIPESRHLGGKPSLKIRFPTPKIQWHVMITLQYSTGFQRHSLLSGDARSGQRLLGRFQTQGNGEARQGPMGWG